MRLSAPIFCLSLVILCVLSVSIGFRFLQLSHEPGLNADEAWPSVQVLQSLQGNRSNWETPSGRTLSPLYRILVQLSHALFPHSFLTIRYPAVLSGLILLLLSYPLFQSFLTRSTALTATLLTASLPLHIAYSRIGWEPCLSSLVTLLVLFFSIKGYLMAVWICLWAAISVHTTNIFLVPIALILLHAKPNKHFSRKGVLLSFIFLVATVLFVIHSSSGLDASSRMTPLKQGIPSLLSSLPNFLYGLLRLLSGHTVYQYFAGHIASFWSHLLDIVSAIFMLGFCLVGFPDARKSPLFKSLALGTAVALLLLFLSSGTYALTPGLERYALFLSIPFILILTLLIESATNRFFLFKKERHFGRVSLACCLSFAWLVSFNINYFGGIRRQHKTQHATYQTNVTEPKLTAYSVLKTERRDLKRPLPVLVEEWWGYWPLVYLNLEDPSLEIVGANPKSSLNDLETFLKKGGIITTFDSSPFEKILRTSKLPLRSLVIRGYAQSPIMTLWKFESNKT